MEGILERGIKQGKKERSYCSQETTLCLYTLQQAGNKNRAYFSSVNMGEGALIHRVFSKVFMRVTASEVVMLGIHQLEIRDKTLYISP